MTTEALFNELLEYLAQAGMKIVMIEKYVEYHDESQEQIRRCSYYKPEDSLNDFIENEKEPRFSEILFDFIDKAGVKASEVYKKAGLDRRHFSKIRSNPDYRPGKSTVLALAVALELSPPDVETLLLASGYSLSKSDKFDLVVRFYLEKEVFDLDVINDALCRLNLKPLAGVVE